MRGRRAGGVDGGGRRAVDELCNFGYALGAVLFLGEYERPYWALLGPPIVSNFLDFFDYF